MGDKLQDLLFNISYRLTALAREPGADDHARLMARAMSLAAGTPSGEVAEAADLDLAKSYASTIAGHVTGRPARRLQHDVARAIFDTAMRLHPAHFKVERSALWLAAQRVLDIDVTTSSKQAYEGRLSDAMAEILELRANLSRCTSLHTEHRMALRDALGLRDDEATDNVTGDFKALCERVGAMRQESEAMRRTAWRGLNIDRLAKALRIDESADVDSYTMIKRVESAVDMSSRLRLDLASVTEQRNVIKRQLEELRAEIQEAGSVKRVLQRQVDRLRHDPSLPQPKQVEPGGPIWVRVVDTSSKHFGLVGRLEGIEFDSKYGDEMWSVDMGGIANVRWRANVFAVVGTGRQGPGPNEAPKPDVEHQQAQNRDQWRATCLANGAKDCTVFFGPGEEVTFVVEMNQCTRKTISEIKEALMVEHCLPPTAYTIREVRPGVAGAVRKASEP